MGVHDAIEYYSQSVQQVLDVDGRLSASQFLPGLVESMNRLSEVVQDARKRLSLWDDVYGLPPQPVMKLTWDATHKLIGDLGDPEAILGLPATTISQLQNQVAEVSTLWRNAHMETDLGLEEHREIWKRELALLESVTNIPDLLMPDEHAEVRTLTNDLRLLLNLSIQSYMEAVQYHSNWCQKTEQFRAVKNRLSFEAIGTRYHLSTDSLRVLKDLANRKRVSLSELSSQTLEELHQFQHFCEAVTLNFSTSPRKEPDHDFRSYSNR